MRAFWDEFSKAVDQTKDLKISDVITALDQDLGPHFFPAREDGSDPRLCAACGTGRLGLKLGRLGSFIGCSNYPECRFTRSLAVDPGAEGGDTLKDGQRTLGVDPTTGEEITVRRGPYGLYVQRGEQTEDKKVRPKRTTLPRGMDGDLLTLEDALGLLDLPRIVGVHPDTQEPIRVAIGPFGPYVKMGSVTQSLDRDDSVVALGLNRAVDLIAKGMASTRTLGEHPKGELVAVRKGRFGPYVKHGQRVANLPRGTTMDEVTLDEAVALLAEKGKMLKPRGAAARKGRAAKGGGRAGAKAAAAEGAPAPAKARAAPRKQAARPVAKAKPATAKRATGKKKAGAKKAKARAAR